MTLKKQTLLGLLWSFVDSFLVKALIFVAMIFLARWLGPRDFGLVGMIAVFIAVGKTLTDSGMTSSLIRTKKTDESDYSTVFIINVLMSILIYLIIYLSAPFIADFFGELILVNVLRLYCLVFLLIALSGVQLAILTKEMNFKKITKINLPSTLLGVMVGLYLGFNGYGIWSIIWMYIVIEAVKSTLLWTTTNWKPKFIFSNSKFTIHYNFGYKLMLSALLSTIFRNLYNILIGKFYPAQTLGFYERAKQFSEYPPSTLTGVINKVTYPLLSKIQDNPTQLESVYRKLIRISFFLIAPLMLGAAALAEPLFLITLGQDWLASVVIFQILSLAMMLYPIHAFNLNILKVYGRSDLFLKLEIIKKFITVIAVLVAFQFGIIGLIWSSVFTSFAALCVNMYYSSSLINYPIKQQFLDLSQTFLLAVIMAIIMNQLVLFLSNLPILLQLILASVSGVIFYITVNYFIKKSPLHQALWIIKTKKQ